VSLRHDIPEIVIWSDNSSWTDSSIGSKPAQRASTTCMAI